MTGDLAPSDLAVVGDTYFVRHIRVGELFFRLSDERNLRNGVDAIRIAGGIAFYVQAKRTARGNAPLFHRYGCETGKTDDVADRENVRLCGAKVGVDLDAPAIVGGQTRRR